VEPYDREPDRLEALEPDHVAAFDAFRRSAGPEDRKIAEHVFGHTGLHSSLNADLARRVYATERGSIDIIPGPGTVCVVSICANTGETTSGHTSIPLAAADGLGHVRSFGGFAVDFVGVLPTGASNLRIIDGKGQETAVPLNDDRAYWVTVADPVDMVWTTATGSNRQGVFGRFKLRRVFEDPSDEPDANGSE
jgi:hypothetical protein